MADEKTPATMFEYMTGAFHDDPAAINQMLNDYGLAGWELVSMVATGDHRMLGVMKREHKAAEEEPAQDWLARTEQQPVAEAQPAPAPEGYMTEEQEEELAYEPEPEAAPEDAEPEYDIHIPEEAEAVEAPPEEARPVHRRKSARKKGARVKQR